MSKVQGKIKMDGHLSFILITFSNAGTISLQVIFNNQPFCFADKVLETKGFRFTIYYCIVVDNWVDFASVSRKQLQCPAICTHSRPVIANGMEISAFDDLLQFSTDNLIIHNFINTIFGNYCLKPMNRTLCYS